MINYGSALLADGFCSFLFVLLRSDEHCCSKSCTFRLPCMSAVLFFVLRPKPSRPSVLLPLPCARPWVYYYFPFIGLFPSLSTQNTPLHWDAAAADRPTMTMMMLPFPIYLCVSFWGFFSFTSPNVLLYSLAFAFFVFRWNPPSYGGGGDDAQQK